MTFHALNSRFKLEKDFNERTLRLTNLDSGKEINTYKESQDTLKKMIGVTNEAIYKKTAFISQGQVALIDSSDDLLHEVTNVSGGGQTGVDKIVKKLQSDLAILNRGIDHPANNPGPIKLQQDKIIQLEKVLLEKKTVWERRQTASDKHESSGDELKSVKEKISEIEELMGNYKIAKDAKVKLTDLNSQINEIEEKIQEVSKLAEQISSIQTRVDQYKVFSNDHLDQDLKAIVEAEQTIKLTKKEVDSMKDSSLVEQHRIDQELTQESKEVNKNVPILILILTVIIAVLGYIYTSNYLIPVAIVLLGLVSSAILFLKRKGFDNSNYQEELVKQQSAGADIIHNLQEKFEQSSEVLKSILSKYEVGTSSDFYEKKADYTALKVELADKVRTRDIALGGKSMDILNAKQRELLIAKKEIETNVMTDKVVNSVISSEQYLQKGRELDKLIIRKNRLEEDVIVSKTRVTDSGVEYSELVTLEEQLANSKQYLQTLFRKQKVITLAIVALEEAVRDVSKSANHILLKTVHDNLPALTNKRYEKVKVSSDLSIKVYANEKNDWVDPVSELSRGTIDQIYFLCRLGFLKLITENNSLPIILDDPFVTSDQHRRENFKELLSRISAQYQILLFTNDNYYSDWGNTVSLSTPSK
jgi:myosin heavy subunit